jgi:hypothetical protein
MRLFILIFFLVFFFISSCSSNKKKDLTKIDSVLQNQKTDSLNAYPTKEELIFKRWLKDTLLILKQDKSFKNGSILVNSKYINIESDSLSLEIRTIIDDTIDFKIKYPIKTWIGGTLYNLESERVNLPKKPYELKIDVMEIYGLSSSKNLIYDKSYEYNYISARPLGSKIETYFSIIKGNLIQTLEKESSSDWFLKDR